VGSAIVAELTAAGFADAEEIWPRRIRHGLSVYPVALDRVVAVKVLTAELDEDRERFLREQRAMGRLTRLQAKRTNPSRLATPRTPTTQKTLLNQRTRPPAMLKLKAPKMFSHWHVSAGSSGRR